MEQILIVAFKKKFRLQPKIKLQKLNVDINNEISLNLNLEHTSKKRLISQAENEGIVYTDV
jgi:hypothetical protein